MESGFTVSFFGFFYAIFYFVMAWWCFLRQFFAILSDYSPFFDVNPSFKEKGR